MAAANRPLIAASKLTGEGYQVRFDKNGGTITHALTGKVTTFVKTHGVYALKVWVPKAAATEKSTPLSWGIRQ